MYMRAVRLKAIVAAGSQDMCFRPGPGKDFGNEELQKEYCKHLDDDAFLSEEFLQHPVVQAHGP